MGPQPGLGVRQVLTATLIVASAVALLRTTADPDLWGHVRFGQDILAIGELPRADTYSFTSDRDWINHEWLAEVAMALAFQAGGAVGLNLLRLVVIGLTLGVVWAHLKDVELLLRLQLLAVAGVGVLLRVHPLRPQIFSVLLFAVLLWLIARAEQHRSMAPLMVVPLLMIAWVNLHGGWIVGMGALGYWIVATAATRQVSSRRLVLLASIGMAAFLATAVNPYGMEMWRFLAETVRIERAMISDWEPLHTLPPGFAALWLVPPAVAIVAVMRAPDRVDWMRLGLVALLGLASLRVSRLDAFFALAAVFLMGPLLSNAHQAAENRATPALVTRGSFLTLASALLVVVGVGAWEVPRIQLSQAVPESEATRYIRDSRLEGRMLIWFDWGEYAIWHLSPEIRVSIDGRRETVYTDEVMTNHLSFYAGAEGAENYADAIRADYVWVPRRLPAVRKLLARGWQTGFEGPVSVLLTRTHVPPTVRSTAPSELRTFPGM